jgi:hypothetical protein
LKKKNPAKKVEKKLPRQQFGSPRHHP